MCIIYIIYIYIILNCNMNMNVMYIYIHIMYTYTSTYLHTHCSLPYPPFSSRTPIPSCRSTGKTPQWPGAWTPRAFLPMQAGPDNLGVTGEQWPKPKDDLGEVGFSEHFQSKLCLNALDVSGNHGKYWENLGCPKKHPNESKWSIYGKHWFETYLYVYIYTYTFFARAKWITGCLRMDQLAQNHSCQVSATGCHKTLEVKKKE